MLNQLNLFDYFNLFTQLSQIMQFEQLNFLSWLCIFSGSSIETSMTTLTNQDRGCSNVEPKVIMAPCQRYDRQIVTSWENGLIQFFWLVDRKHKTQNRKRDLRMGLIGTEI